MSNRTITSFNPAKPTTDGAGVAIKRVALFEVSSVDPVLMIDELKSPYREDLKAGFPPRPHRGMQTRTYMLEGGIAHEDSMGNRGEIREGGVQWMSLGSGVIHFKVPTQDTTVLHGFQLWFNLPARLKMSEPRYRDIAGSELPSVSANDVTLSVTAGDRKVGEESLQGPLNELSSIAQMADLQLAPDAEYVCDVPAAANTMAFAFEGSLDANAQDLRSPGLVVFEAGNSLVIRASKEGARCLLLTGRPNWVAGHAVGPFCYEYRKRDRNCAQ